MVLDHAADTGLLEALPREQGPGGHRRNVEAQHGVGDDLGAVDQQRVLDEELIPVLETGPERRGQQLRSEFSLELH